ncbi:MAG TPA: hypothetical protein VJ890_21195 [Vineibacter sp.]|nr:hypothetical protein [Vineibacter sp.]
MAESFTCPRCGAVSHNPGDIANRYCGRCHAFVDDPRRPPAESVICALAKSATFAERRRWLMADPMTMTPFERGVLTGTLLTLSGGLIALVIVWLIL